MQYFQNLPKIYYDFNINGENVVKILRDVSVNIRFQKELLSDITLYDEYDIVDGETPEILAEKVYGNPGYHWIIMLMNERYDYINEWPLTSLQFELYMQDKYGKANFNAIHHYRDSNGHKIASTEMYYSPHIANHLFMSKLENGSNIVQASDGVTYASMNDGAIGEVIQVAGLGLPFGEVVTITQFLNDRSFTMSHAATETLETDLTFIHLIDPMIDATPVTNYEYEFEINEAKRRVKLINPSMIPAVLTQLENLVNG